MVEKKEIERKYLGQIPAVSIFHHYMQGVIFKKRGIKLYYIRVFNFAQYLSLLNGLALSFRLQLTEVYLFHYIFLIILL